MSARIIDGKAASHHVRQDCKKWTDELIAKGVMPGLAVVIVGDNPASMVYVANTVRACHEVGLHSKVHAFDANMFDHLVFEKILALNADQNVQGKLVQLPLPKHFDVRRILGTIYVDKDVDGFHLYNVGALAHGETVFPPCTPYGVSKMLEHESIPVEGQNVVVVGASNIVGKPMAMVLKQRDATVWICHAKTRDLAQFTILADILVVAAGVPKLILPQMVRAGSVVIVVGINRLPIGKLVGDVDFEGVRQKASHTSPVPGSVGPMTITMLVHNTVQAAKRSIGEA